MRLVSNLNNQPEGPFRSVFRLGILDSLAMVDYWQWFIDNLEMLGFETSHDLGMQPLFIEPVCQLALERAENSLGDFQRFAPDVALADIQEDIGEAVTRFEQFLAQLDPHALALIRQCGPPELLTVASYNLLHSPATRIRRRQAFEAYPWLGRLLFSADFKNIEAQNSILAAVDRGTPLEKAMEKFLSISAWAVRRMKSCEKEHVFWGVGDNMLDIVHALSSRAPDIWPAENNELDGLEAICLWLKALELPGEDEIFLEIIRNSRTSFAKEVRSLILGRESIEELKCNLRCAGHGDEYYVTSLDLVQRYLNALVRTTAGTSASKVRQLFSNWIKRYGLKSIMNAALYWCEAGGGVAGNWDALTDWTPVSSGQVQIGSWSFIELCERQTLEAEGDAMRHCAANYALACKFYGYRFFSLRDKHGNRLATVSICPEFQYDLDLPEEFAYYLVEIKGPGNVCVGEELGEAAEKLLDVINAPENLRQRIAAGHEMLNSPSRLMQRDFVRIPPVEIKAVGDSLLLSSNAEAMELLEIVKTRDCTLP